MKTFIFPSPGTVDSSFTPSPDCTMLYTEQLSWFLLKYYELAYSQSFEAHNFRSADSELVAPSEFYERTEQWEYLEQINDQLTAAKNYLNNLQQSTERINDNTAGIDFQLTQIRSVFDTYPDYLERFVRFTRDFAGISEDYDGNPVDGLSELKGFIDSDITSIATWIGSALQAAEDEVPIPALPVLALITKFVPAKYALLIKFGVDIIGKLLMSYIKGRLEHPDVAIDGLNALVDVLQKGLLDSEDISFLAPEQLTEDWSVSFGETGSPRFVFFPRWNCIDSITSE